ncbi:MAG: sigma-70 family RNA polymerase sigma factor [Cyanobacteria bacterium CRU_2_1]|nr:sigma-70 family RNA polymerase sigma factor [Cyanobacteria bacterium RU_5_0]NJR61041.1 sigma-70 family RNA polymerase sigma factor [Cyanobacteria bacterium CRU_2_1]
MQIPSFPECRHPLVSALNHYNDQDLLTLFQRHPDTGKYFVALFGRYSPIVYSLIRHSVRSPAQADYLFAVTWRHIYFELGGLNLHEHSTPDKPFTLQSWLINITAVCINCVALPPVEEIQYSLQNASPPLWCYLEQALDRLSPVQRLMILMAQTFHWSETRIAAYLQAEGEVVTPRGVKRQLDEAYQALEVALPEDIAEIYLDRLSPNSTDSNTETAHDDVFALDPLEPIFE